MNKISVIQFTPSTRGFYIDCNGKQIKKHVEAVYSGRHGCACGCRGKHTHYTENKRAITTIVNKILAQGEVQDLDWETTANPNWVSVTTDTRYYIAYFEEEETK